MLSRSPRDARQCRLCKQGEPHVRFATLSFRICTRCKARAVEESARRLALNPPALAPAQRPGRPGLSPAHLAWVRARPCLVGAHRCGTKVHAHHVRNGTGGGTGLKPDDRWAVPLCAAHHSELHTGGHATFEARHRVDLRATAEGLARLSPHLAPIAPPPAERTIP